MLPPSLVSVYQQYKEDTNAVASWLASTAKSRGYPADLLSGASSQATVPEHSKRLKGKARKQAKAAAQEAQASSSTPSNPDYIIAIKDFIPLAEFVAASKKPVISVPLSFAKTLNRVISTRSGFGSRLAELSDSPDVSADSTHSYFVGVLEKVREVLTPRFPLATRDTASVRTQSNPVTDIGGRFAGLSVEEPSAEFLNAPAIERPAPVKDDNHKYVAEPLHMLEEVLFAYRLLVMDLDKIRDRIEWIWKNYREGIFELVAAAIATNTACDLARNLMGDIAPMLKAHGGVVEIARRFYVSQCLEQGFSLDDITAPGSTEEFNYDTYEIANSTYMVAIMVLEKCLDEWGPDGVVLFNEPLCEAYDPISDWSGMTKPEVFQKDESLLLEHLSELTIIVRCVENYPVSDELLRGMEELRRTKDIPMYLVFAAQTFLDVHHVLGKHVCSAYETCMSHLELMDEDLALHEEFLAKCSSRASPAYYDYASKELRQKIKCLRADPTHGIKVEMSSEMDFACNAPLHQVLRYSPVISGLMLYHFRSATYLLGLKMSNYSGAITYPMHLYNALQQEKLLSPQQVPTASWEDMDVVLALLGKDSFYVGSEPPSNPHDYMMKLALQMGASAGAFCKRTLTCEHVIRSNKIFSKQGPRFVKKDRAPISDMFVDRYLHNTGQVDWTPELVDRIISGSPWQDEGLNEDGALILGKITEPEKLRERKINDPSKTAGKNKRAAASSQMLPHQLIRNLIIALHTESLTLSLSYLTLQRAAWGMIHEVRIAIDPLLLEPYEDTRSDGEGQAPFVVDKIFCELLAGNGQPFLRAGDIFKEQ